jgi:hypothetical protein
MAFDIAEFSIVGSGPLGEEIVNTFRYQSTDPVTSPPNLPLLLTGFLGFVQIPYLACLTHDYTYVKSRVKIIYGPDLGMFSEDATSAGAHGTSGGLSAPLQVAICVKRLSTNFHRYGRGRLFMSPINSTYFNMDGVITTTPVWLAALRVAMLDGPSDGVNTWEPVLWGGPAHGALEIVDVQVSTVLASRRSRRGPGA